MNLVTCRVVIFWCCESLGTQSTPHVFTLQLRPNHRLTGCCAWQLSPETTSSSSSSSASEPAFSGHLGLLWPMEPDLEQGLGDASCREAQPPSPHACEAGHVRACAALGGCSCCRRVTGG
eukprot:353479-Chlamydomonas_euryale.AAC.2